MKAVKSPEEAEAYVEEIAKHITKVFHSYIVKQRRKHGEFIFPALLNTCAKIVIAVVKTFPEEEQTQALKEYASLLSHLYAEKGGPPVEKSRIIVPGRMH